MKKKKFILNLIVIGALTVFSSFGKAISANIQDSTGLSTQNLSPSEQVQLDDFIQNYFQPVQSVQQMSQSLSIGNRSSHIPLDQKAILEIKKFKVPDKFRVLIFPHIGRYSTPQGREKVINQFELSSDTQCAVRVKTNANGPYVLKENAAKILFTVENTKFPTKVNCQTPAKLHRDANQVAYEYQGIFEVLPSTTKDGVPYLRVVLELPFEEYLRGVVPAEMPSHWDMEALKAQAIAARTYALYQIQFPQLDNFVELNLNGRDFDVDDTVFDQAFLGLSRVTSATDQAILATQHLTLVAQGMPIKAFFSADSGGYTEISQNVWRVIYPFCPTKPEVYDLKLVKSDWSVVNSLTEIQTALVNRKLIPANPKIKGLQMLDLNKSGRSLKIRILFENGTFVDLFGPDFQQALRFKSNLFTRITELENQQIKFEGLGFGHGVGMNQWGARVLAQSLHWDYRQILLFYFAEQ